MADYIKSNDYMLYLPNERLKTFKSWPLGFDCNCTPNKLAAAGFFHCPTEDEPDAVRCFFCMKELDGWEPNDDPWAEHQSHSPKCPFLIIGKKAMESWTVAEFSDLHQKSMENKINKVMDIHIATYREKMKTQRLEIQRHFKRK
ncbi:baculoviral IAP repeat-containing protein 5 [Magallana gigas]|uniref:baculoviral IAP repeat-containing protein 5 n=1 Tax=Magallana gigas TaxID=29159 RepID=UPI0033409A71